MTTEPRLDESVDDEDPAEQGGLNVDFREWMDSLDPVLHRVAMLLQEGKTLAEIGKEFGFSRGWASLKKGELAASYEAYFGG